MAYLEDNFYSIILLVVGFSKGKIVYYSKNSLLMKVPVNLAVYSYSYEDRPTKDRCN